MDLFTLFYILLLVTMLTVLVAAHEYGHFLFARIFKMDVEEFAIGFGRPPWRYMKRNGTEFTFRPLPLGGFVRIKGMVMDEDSSERTEPGGFYSKPAWQRIVVLFAGPLFSILAGLAILIPLHSAYGVRATGTTIGEIAPASAASKSILQKGDRIISIDGVPVATFLDVAKNVRDKAGQTVTFRFERNGVPGVAELVPELSAAEAPLMESYVRPPTQFRRQARVGIAPDPAQSVKVRVPWVESTVAALAWPVDMTKGIVGSIIRPSTFKENVGGPGSIVKVTYAAAKDGIDSFIRLAALLSISLGIFNLLPFGMFDGGQILLNFLEILRGGRRMSLAFVNAFMGVGFVLIAILIIGAIAADVDRFRGKDQEPAPTAPSPKSPAPKP